MSEHGLAFAKKITFLSTTVVHRPRLIAAVLAVVLSRELALPAGAVESPAAYFSMNHTVRVNTALSLVNEQTPIPVKECVRMVLQLWSLRYNAAFPRPMHLTTPVDGFVDAYVDAGLSLPPELVGFLNEHKATILGCSDEMAQWITKQ